MKRTKLILPVVALVLAGSAGITWATADATGSSSAPTAPVRAVGGRTPGNTMPPETTPIDWGLGH